MFKLDVRTSCFAFYIVPNIILNLKSVGQFYRDKINEENIN